MMKGTIQQKVLKNGLLNSSYEFLIPVYEEMPDTACTRP